VSFVDGIARFMYASAFCIVHGSKFCGIVTLAMLKEWCYTHDILCTIPDDDGQITQKLVSEISKGLIIASFFALASHVH